MRWQPNKQQREEYKEMMTDRENMKFIESDGALREGCKVKFHNKNENRIIEGIVTKSSYGADKGQHTFTILENDGKTKRVKGRNFYDSLLSHKQGFLSKIENLSFLDQKIAIYNHSKAPADKKTKLSNEIRKLSKGINLTEKQKLEIKKINQQQSKNKGVER